MDATNKKPQLKFSNGNNFPPNFKFIAYIFLGASILIMASGGVFISIGIILSIFPIFAISHQHFTVIDTKKNHIHEYSEFLGFIKVGKKYPMNKFKYVTNMPFILSQRVHSRILHSYSISNNYTSVTLFGERLRGKLIITKFESKDEAIKYAKQLAEHLNLQFFEYDPLLVRKVILGHKKL